MNKKGFTLIEILIALTVFAILATLTSSSLYYAFTARTRVNAQADRLNNLQLAVSLIEQDTIQIVDRPIRSNEMRLFSMLVGMPDYVEFTRDGYINPNSIDKRSSLKRVALVCLDKKLVRRTWESLDSKDRNAYGDRILLDNLTDCHFNYLNHTLQLLTKWREQTAQPNQSMELFPKAIQVNVTLQEWGEMNLLFIIPGGLYAPSK